jgi:hypothetical protein
MKLWSENLKGRDNSVDLGVDGRIILECRVEIFGLDAASQEGLCSVQLVSYSVDDVINKVLREIYKICCIEN